MARAPSEPCQHATTTANQAAAAARSVGSGVPHQWSVTGTRCTRPGLARSCSFGMPFVVVPGVLGRCKVQTFANMASTHLDWPWPSVVVNQRTWCLCAQYPTVQQGACPMAATGTYFFTFSLGSGDGAARQLPVFPPSRRHDNETLAMAGSSLATSRLGGGSPLDTRIPSLPPPPGLGRSSSVWQMPKRLLAADSDCYCRPSALLSQ
jgi:hypothetical protein